MINLAPPLENKEYISACGIRGSYCFPAINNFIFDLDFQNLNKLPPLTPQAVYLQQSVYSKQ